MRITSQVVFALLVCSACTDEPWPRPASIPPEQFAREFYAWRDYRRSRLIAPGPGPVTWVGLWELQPGKMLAGGDSTLPIVLPVTQSLLGSFERSGATVRFEPNPRGDVRIGNGGQLDTAVALASDRTDTPTTLAAGTLRLRVHGEPGTDRLWLRVWDEEHPARATFKLPESYPPDPAWQFSARFERFKQPRNYRVADITNGTQAYRATGELVFRTQGREHRLVAFAEPKDTMFFVMVWDSTAKTTTYQGGRYMRVPLPDTTRWTILDFNRAYNPPCVFTSFSTCAFPPAENRLKLSINAGEKRAH